MPGVARPSSPDPALARAIRDLRQRRGLSQEAAAQRAGLTVSAYARIERGEANPTWTTVTQVAHALEMTLVDLASTVEKNR